MAGGEPKQPDDDHRRQRQLTRLAVWSQLIGAMLAIATMVLARLGDISAQQAVALGLPAAVLVVGGLIIAAAVDPSDGERHGFLTGLRVGTFLRRLRSLFGRRRDS